MPPPLQGAEAHARGLTLLGAIRTAFLPEQGVPSAPGARRQRAWRQMTRREGAHPNLMASAPGVSALVRVLETMEEELAIRVIPEERSVMLLQVSKTMRTAMQRVSPPAMIKAKEGETYLTESVQRAMLDMIKWCRITAIDLSNATIGAEGAGRLAAVLGQCASLAHLDLQENRIGAEGAGRLAGVLGQCASLARLDLCNNEIGAEGAGRLAAVLGQCASLAHLNLYWNEIGAEGVGRLAAVAEDCPSLTIHFHRSWG